MLPWRFRLYVSKGVEWKITELDRKWQNVPLNVSICDIQNIWKCNVNIECLCFVCILQLYIYLHCLQLNKVVKLHSLILTASCIYAVKVKKVQNQTYINCEEEESKKKTWNCSYKSWQIQKHLTFFTRWRKRSGVILLDFQEDILKSMFDRSTWQVQHINTLTIVLTSYNLMRHMTHTEWKDTRKIE